MASLTGTAKLSNCTVQNTLKASSGIQLGAGSGTSGTLSFNGGIFYMDDGTGASELYSGKNIVSSIDTNLLLTSGVGGNNITTTSLALNPTIAGLTSFSATTGLFTNLNVSGTGTSVNAATFAGPINLNNNTALNSAGSVRYGVTSAGTKTDINDGYNWNTILGGVYSYPTPVQGGPFDATGNSAGANLGTAVIITPDGTTVAVGCPQDNGGIGSVIIFANTAGTLVQQARLVGTGSIGSANQGTAIAITRDSSFLAVGGPNDNGGIGAVWLFGKSSGTWSQLQKVISSSIGDPVTTQFGLYLAIVRSAGLVHVYAACPGTTVDFYSSAGNGQVQGSSSNSLVGGRSYTIISKDSTKLIYYQPFATRISVLTSANQGDDGFTAGSFNISSVSGCSALALSGSNTTLVVGNNTDNSNAGTVTVFTLTPTSATELCVIAYPSTSYFGTSVAVSDDSQVIWITEQDPAGVNAGKLHQYQYNSQTLGYDRVGLILPTGITSSKNFGSSLAYSALVLATGAPLDVTGNGSALTFRYNATLGTIGVTSTNSFSGLQDFPGGFTMESLYSINTPAAITYLPSKLTKKCARLQISSTGAAAATVTFMPTQFGQAGFSSTINTAIATQISLSFVTPFINDYVVSVQIESPGTPKYYMPFVTSRTSSGFALQFFDPITSGGVLVNLSGTAIILGTLNVSIICEGC